MAPKSRWGRKERDGTKVVQPAEPAAAPVLPVRERRLELKEDDCDCVLIENYFTIAECSRFMAVLRDEIDWQRREVTLSHIDRENKTVGEPRMTLFMSDPGICYAYSGRDNEGVGWHPTLLEIKEKAEQAMEQCGVPPVKFNSVQMNRYNHPRHTLGLHMDNEPDLCKGAPIASVSFGAPRDFVIQHGANPDESYNLELADGSFCLMAGAMQKKYLHGIPVGGSGLRFNLTFRVCIPRNGGPAPLAHSRPGDWQCPKCNQMNFARHLHCGNCGFAKPEGAGAERRVPGHHQAPSDRNGGYLRPAPVSAKTSVAVPAKASVPAKAALRNAPEASGSGGWGRLAAQDEKRVDPHDGLTCNFKELQQRYMGSFSEAEILEYWKKECKPTFDISSSGSGTLQAPLAPRRVDPDDGRHYTCEEILRKYKGQFSESEIRAYWRDECAAA